MSEPASLTERHIHSRRNTLCAGKFSSGDRTVDCEVLNISVGGAKIRLAEPVETNAQVSIAIQSVGEFTGRVAWRNGTTLGVEFQDELRELARMVEEVLGQDNEVIDQRGNWRTSVLWSGQLRSAGQEVECRILNISPSGVQIRAESPIDCGLVVVLFIERFGEFGGKLVWQDGPIIGIQFDDPPDRIERIFGDALHVPRADELEG